MIKKVALDANIFVSALLVSRAGGDAHHFFIF